jgi:hypothetical protein
MTRLGPGDRQGRCFELAWKHQNRDERFFFGWTLVHGTVVSRIGDGNRIAHAWLQLDDTIYDPVFDRTFDRDSYTAEYQAEPITQYTPEEAIRAALAHAHFGPWPPAKLNARNDG